MFIFNEPRLVIRKIPSCADQIFLTFDDGPNKNTLQVLELLKKHNALATFFVIGDALDQNFEIAEAIINAGHAIYSHSIDHNYSHFFKTKNKVQYWLTNSINHLNNKLALKTHAFRPPAGILNPPLIAAATSLNLPIILWKYRFYDSIFNLTFAKINKILNKVKSGDIILLHDNQKNKNIKNFLISLDYLLNECKKRNLNLKKITQDDISKAINN